MAATISFWHRVGSIFRHETSGNGHSLTPDGPTPMAPVAAVGTVESAGNGKLPLHLPRDPRPLTRRERKAASLAALQDGHERLVSLVNAMKEHFERQDKRFDQLATSVDRVATYLEQIPEVQRRQGDCMSSIAAHLETANRQSSELKDTLARVPSSIQAQAEAIHAVSRKIEASNNADAQLAGSLQTLGEVVESLSQAGSDQVEVMRQMRTESDQQKQALVSMIKAQTLRFTLTLIVAGVLGSVAVAGLAYTLWTLINRQTA